MVDDAASTQDGADPRADVRPTCAVAQGQLQGVTEAGVHRFLGVPYAQPPVGNRRWAAPRPPLPWSGVRQATAFGNAAVQALQVPYDLHGVAESEDCLYLNIWTRTLDPGTRQPVMVWIHGGGNLYGAASDPMYDGASLARRGVTLISFNYRLGVFGFLAHPLVGANFAVLDYVAALRWVRENAASFGGDPDNVTIFGQSAGAVAVRTLLACPPAAGLFHQAIIQSAGFEAPATGEWWSRERNQAAATELFATVGSDDPAVLRATPTRKVLEASTALSGSKDRPGYVRTPAQLVWMPVIDDEIVRADGHGGWSKDVPVMLGTVENESRFFLHPTRQYDRSLLERMTASLAGPAAPEVMALFDASNLDPYEALDPLVTTVIFTEPASETVERFAAAGRNVRYYHFTRCSPGAIANRLLAAHGSELPYLFGTLPAEDGYYDAADRAVSESIQEAWTSFARTGEVTSGQDLVWARYDNADSKVAIIDEPVRVERFDRTELARVLKTFRDTCVSRPWLG